MFAKPKTHLSLDEIDQQIPDLRAPDGPGRAVHELAGRREYLKDQKRRLHEELQRTPGHDVLAGRYDYQEDAHRLCEGEPVESLVGPDAVSRRATLLRRFHAVENALVEIDEQVRSTALRVAAQTAEELVPLARVVLGDLLDAFEKTQAALERQLALEALFSRKGFDPALLPPAMRFLPYESQMLHGDSKGRCSLAYWISERKRFLEGK